jgi:hypothetical protein
MEEKKYPVIEEESGMDMCCESPVGYASTDSAYANTLGTSDDEVMDVAEDWDPGIGPYTVEERNTRIDEAEVLIEKAEKGDWSDWVSEEQSRANLYSKYPWLR